MRRLVLSAAAVWVVAAGAHPLPATSTPGAAAAPAAPRRPAEPAPVKLASGVTYVDLAKGEGAAVGRGARVTLHYRLSLADGTLVADTRRDRRPLVLRLGAGQAVRGLEEGLLGMRVEGQRRIEVPAALGYGRRTLPDVPAGSDLVFVVSLLAVD